MSVRKEILYPVVIGFILGIPSGAYFFYKQNAWASDMQLIVASLDDWRLQQVIDELEYLDEIPEEDMSQREKARQKKLEREYEMLLDE